MSLPLPALLTALATAQFNEVAPALQMFGEPGAPDPNYAGGTAATAALILFLAAAEAAAHGPRNAEAASAAQPLLGQHLPDRDTRAAALGMALAAGNRAALALLRAEAAAEWAAVEAIGLSPPVPVEMDPEA